MEGEKEIFVIRTFFKWKESDATHTIDGNPQNEERHPNGSGGIKEEQNTATRDIFNYSWVGMCASSMLNLGDENVLVKLRHLLRG